VREHCNLQVLLLLELADQVRSPLRKLQVTRGLLVEVAVKGRIQADALLTGNVFDAQLAQCHFHDGRAAHAGEDVLVLDLGQVLAGGKDFSDDCSHAVDHGLLAVEQGVHVKENQAGIREELLSTTFVVLGGTSSLVTSHAGRSYSLSRSRLITGD